MGRNDILWQKSRGADRPSRHFRQLPDLGPTEISLWAGGASRATSAGDPTTRKVNQEAK